MEESLNPAALIDQRSTGTMLQLENLLTWEQTIDALLDQDG